MKECFADMFKKQEVKYDAIFQAQTTFNQSQSASIKSLENQIRQLANAQSCRLPENLPSNTEPNPMNVGKEQCHAIILKSGIAINKNVGVKETVEEVPKESSEAVPQMGEKKQRKNIKK